MRISTARFTKQFLRRTAAIGALLPFWVASAQIVLTDGDGVAAINPDSQAGVSQWAIDGENEVQQQWFWYGIGAGAVQSIDTISATPGIVTMGTRELTATYTSVGNFSVSVDYVLTGEPDAVGAIHQGQMSETIKIANLSASTLPYHFYEYSYFNLGAASRDIVQLGQDGTGMFNNIVQSNSQDSLVVSLGAQEANRGEVAPVGLTLARLNSGGTVTLGSPFGAGPVGPGAVTAALEWDLDIRPGASATITQIDNLQIVPIPEPSIALLITLVLAATAFPNASRRLQRKTAACAAFRP